MLETAGESVASWESQNGLRNASTLSGIGVP